MIRNLPIAFCWVVAVAMVLSELYPLPTSLEVPTYTQNNGIIEHQSDKAEVR